MVKLLHLVLLLCCVQAFSQGIDPRRLFSYKVKEHLKQYANNADNAYAVPETYIIKNLSKKVIKKYLGPLDNNALKEIKKIIN